MKRWTISASESGAKLIDFLKDHMGKDYSARQLKRLIETNGCQINGRKERFASTILGAGDEVQFLPEASRHPPLNTIEPSRILYEDEGLFIYNKPPGIASEGLDFPGLELIHRLDKETSGVLMFAKTAQMREAMIKEFRHKQVKKTYVAIVHGVPAKPKGVVDNTLGKIAQYQGQSVWGSVAADKGVRARTEWEMKHKGKQASLVYCTPITGRTHQIRVHLSEMGYPILGDHAYGKRGKSYDPATRCCLHALAVDFIQPLKGKPLHVEADIPEDMQNIIQQLGIQ